MSREATPTTPAYVRPKIESFRMVGFSRVTFAPLLNVARTDDGRSTGINDWGLTYVGRQV